MKPEISGFQEPCRPCAKHSCSSKAAGARNDLCAGPGQVRPRLRCDTVGGHDAQPYSAPACGFCKKWDYLRPVATEHIEVMLYDDEELLRQILAGDTLFGIHHHIEVSVAT